MRPLPASDVSLAIEVTSRFPHAHGAHSPGSMLIIDLKHPGVEHG
jgi:uncharacterized protein YcsI (UPF0317 family)